MAIMRMTKGSTTKQVRGGCGNGSFVFGNYRTLNPSYDYGSNHGLYGTESINPVIHNYQHNSNGGIFWNRAVTSLSFFVFFRNINDRLMFNESYTFVPDENTPENAILYSPFSLHLAPTYLHYKYPGFDTAYLTYTLDPAISGEQLLYKWTHISVSSEDGKAILFINGKKQYLTSSSSSGLMASSFVLYGTSPYDNRDVNISASSFVNIKEVYQQVDPATEESVSSYLKGHSPYPAPGNDAYKLMCLHAYADSDNLDVRYNDVKIPALYDNADRVGSEGFNSFGYAKRNSTLSFTGLIPQYDCVAIFSLDGTFKDTKDTVAISPSSVAEFVDGHNDRSGLALKTYGVETIPFAARDFWNSKDKTISFWFMDYEGVANGVSVTPYGDRSSFFSTTKGSSSGSAMQFERNSKDERVLTVKLRGSSETYVTGTTPINYNEWYHVKLSVSGRRFTVYLNDKIEMEGELSYDIKEPDSYLSYQMSIGGSYRGNYVIYPIAIDDLRLYAKATWVRKPSEGSPAHFNKSTYGLSYNVDMLPYGNAPRSMSVWVKPTSFSHLSNSSPYCSIIGYGTLSDNGRYSLYTKLNNLMISGYNNDIVTGIRLDCSKWYHIVTIYDGETNKIYINGELKASYAYTGLNTQKDEAKLSVGCSLGKSEYYCGNITDAAIYDRTLTEEEVRQLYTREEVIDGRVLHLPLASGKDNDINLVDRNYLYASNLENIPQLPAVLRSTVPAYFGGDNYALVDSANRLPADNAPRTLSIWFNTYRELGSSYSYYTLFSYGAIGGNRIEICISGDPLNFIRIQCGTSGYIYCYANESILRYRWHHLALTYDESSTLRVYLDNVLIHTVNTSFTAADTSNLVFGSNISASGDYFYGELADFRAFNRALSSEEISSLYAKDDIKNGLVESIPLMYGEDNDRRFFEKKFGYSGDAFVIDEVPQAPEVIYPDPNTPAYFSATEGVVADTNGLPYGNAARSISAWVRLDKHNTEDSNTYFSYGYNSQHSRYGLGIENDGSALCVFGQGNTTTYNHSFNLNQWYHIVVTFNYDYTEQCYVNGALIGTQTHAGINTQQAGITVGRSTNNSSIGDWFYGNITEVNVYNRVISEYEVQQLYNQQEVSYRRVLHLPLAYEMEDLTIYSARSYRYSGEYPLAGPVPEAPVEPEVPGIPTDSLLLKYDFTGLTAETGQQFTVSGTEAITADNGIPCAYFDGNTVLTANDSTVLEKIANSQEGTVSLWIKKTSRTGTFLEMDNSVFRIKQQESNYKDSVIYGFGSMYYPSTYDSAITNDEWIHLVVTRQNNQSGNTLYINGALVNNTGTHYKVNAGGSSGIYVGSSGFTGYIAAIRIYNRVLTEAEIALLYAEDLTQEAPPDEPDNPSPDVPEETSTTYVVKGAGTGYVDGDYTDIGLTYGSNNVYYRNTDIPDVGNVVIILFCYEEVWRLGYCKEYLETVDDVITYINRGYSLFEAIDMFGTEFYHSETGIEGTWSTSWGGAAPAPTVTIKSSSTPDTPPEDDEEVVPEGVTAYVVSNAGTDWLNGIYIDTGRVFVNDSVYAREVTNEAGVKCLALLWSNGAWKLTTNTSISTISEFKEVGDPGEIIWGDDTTYWYLSEAASNVITEEAWVTYEGAAPAPTVTLYVASTEDE